MQLVGSIRQIDWYRHYPTRLVLRDARAGKPEAFDELERRTRVDSLSRYTAHPIAESALDKLDEWPRAPKGRKWSELLCALDHGGFLTIRQRNRMFPRFARATMDVRPVIRRGQDLVVWLNYQSSRAAIHGYGLVHQTLRVSVGDYVIYHRDVPDPDPLPPDWYLVDCVHGPTAHKTFPTEGIPTGQFLVKYSGKHEFRHPGCYASGVSARWSREVQFKGTVQVLPEDAPDPIRWIDDPEIGESLREAISVDLNVMLDEPGWLRLCCDGRYEYFYFRVEVEQPLPANVAFDVVVQVSDREPPTTLIGSVTSLSRGVRHPTAWRKGEQGGVTGTARIPKTDTDEISLILRASRDVARQTVDMYDIWRGELRFGPFKVEHRLAEYEPDGMCAP